MKKLTFILIQIAFIASAYSQGFLKDGLTWNNTNGGYYSQNSNFTYKVFGDTILGTRTYKIIKENYPDRDTNWNTVIFAREDSSRWFFYVINSLQGEKIYYNFNLNVGDLGYVWNDKSKVENIDSITLENGERRKLIHFKNDWDIWIEGIGSIKNHLDKPLSNLTPYAIPYANLCVKQYDTLLHTLYPDLNCYDTGGIFMNLIDVSLKNDITVYPNPAKEEVNISSTSSINDIEIYDIMGRRVFQTEVRDYSKTINLSLFRKGVYIAKINTEQGVIKKKFIVQ